MATKTSKKHKDNPTQHPLGKPLKKDNPTQVPLSKTKPAK
jgi:hypothetical protein